MLVPSRGFAQHSRPTHIGVDERQRIHQRAVDMGLGGEVDDGVALRGQRVDQPGVTDVAVHESVTGLAVELEEICQVACVCELVEDRDLHLGAPLSQVADEIGADEPGCSRHQEPLQRAAHVIRGPDVQS